MYAVIRTGGKQYRVSQDDVLRVESLKAEVGSTVKFDVLAIGEGEDLRVGKPLMWKAQSFVMLVPVKSRSTNSIAPKIIIAKKVIARPLRKFAFLRSANADRL